MGQAYDEVYEQQRLIDQGLKQLHDKENVEAARQALKIYKERTARKLAMVLSRQQDLAEE